MKIIYNYYYLFIIITIIIVIMIIIICIIIRKYKFINLFKNFFVFIIIVIDKNLFYKY
jgi:hypothetical protein